MQTEIAPIGGNGLPFWEEKETFERSEDGKPWRGNELLAATKLLPVNFLIGPEKEEKEQLSSSASSSSSSSSSSDEHSIISTSYQSSDVINLLSLSRRSSKQNEEGYTNVNRMEDRATSVEPPGGKEFLARHLYNEHGRCGTCAADMRRNDRPRRRRQQPNERSYIGNDKTRNKAQCPTPMDPYQIETTRCPPLRATLESQAALGHRSWTTMTRTTCATLYTHSATLNCFNRSTGPGTIKFAAIV